MLRLCLLCLSLSRISALLTRATPHAAPETATASVDHATDAAIQAMVKKELRGNCTVVTVAHRLNTIVFYDEARQHWSEWPSFCGAHSWPPRGHGPGASHSTTPH